MFSVLGTQRARPASDDRHIRLRGDICAGEAGDSPADVVVLFLRGRKCEGRLWARGDVVTINEIQ